MYCYSLTMSCTSSPTITKKNMYISDIAAEVAHGRENEEWTETGGWIGIEEWREIEWTMAEGWKERGWIMGEGWRGIEWTMGGVWIGIGAWIGKEAWTGTEAWRGRGKDTEVDQERGAIAPGQDRQVSGGGGVLFVSKCLPTRINHLSQRSG